MLSINIMKYGDIEQFEYNKDESYIMDLTFYRYEFEQ